MNRRQPVESLDDIPRFATEDDERAWWETHEFSEALWDSLGLNWGELPFLLPLGISAAESPQVRWNVDVARKYLALGRRAQRKDAGTTSESALMNSVVSLVFSAAAIESALNLVLVAPHFRFSEDAQEAFQSALPPETALPAHEKLRLVLDEYPELLEDANLIQDVEELFLRRNELAHALPSLSGPTSEDIERSTTFHEVARRFVEALRLPVIPVSAR